MTTRLHSDHLQPSGVALGPQKGDLVPCERSAHHGMHPEHEDCAWCPPAGPRLGRLMFEFKRDKARWAGLEHQTWHGLTREGRKQWDKDAREEMELWKNLDTLPRWHPDYQEPYGYRTYRP